MYSIGIDLAWKHKNESGICVLNSDKEIVLLDTAYSDEEIITMIKPYLTSKSVIAIDAPLEFESGRKSRLCEREIMSSSFRRKRISVFCSSESFFLKKFGETRGVSIKDKIQKVSSECTIIETYPGITIANMFEDKIVYKQKRSSKLNYLVKIKSFITKLSVTELSDKVNGLKQNHKVKDIKKIEDKIDGYLCAIVSHCYYHSPNDTEFYGNDGAGKIYTISEIDEQ